MLRLSIFNYISTNNYSIINNSLSVDLTNITSYYKICDIFENWVKYGDLDLFKQFNATLDQKQYKSNMTSRYTYNMLLTRNISLTPIVCGEDKYYEKKQLIELAIRYGYYDLVTWFESHGAIISDHTVDVALDYRMYQYLIHLYDCGFTHVSADWYNLICDNRTDIIDIIMGGNLYKETIVMLFNIIVNTKKFELTGWLLAKMDAKMREILFGLASLQDLEWFEKNIKYITVLDRRKND